MNHKIKKIYLVIFSISIFMIGFYCGIAIQNKKNNLYQGHNLYNKENKVFKTKFFSKAKKNLTENIKINNKIIKSFHNQYEDCLKKALSNEENVELEKITNYILNYQKDDDNYIEIEWNNDNFLKNQIILGKKARKCKYSVLKKITKEEKVEFYKNVKLMKLDDIINLFHGV